MTKQTDGTVDNDWDTDRYDGDHSFVFEYGADLLDLLDASPDDRVLDVGCGTGHLTADVAATGAEVVGVDRSESMIAQARADHPDVRFVRADARSMAFDEPFDAVLSNAALHWIEGDHQDNVLAAVHDALRPGGRFVAELGGTGNVAAIVDAVSAELRERGHDREPAWYFPSVGEYATRLEAAGFEVRFARLFDRPTELDGGADGLRSWLAMFGDALFGPVTGDERDAVVDAVEDRLRPDRYRDETWVADYRRLRFTAVRLP